ncbi:winged helix-turn-helix domain-containing protein [Saccharopolyspora rosea]|uniref:Winged helix-turn-helix domain-containing protein n=1 Tax=Saccharopolyspora rosea TaxID=524884 RepID=A0ABW3G5P0_9PSEU|nr:winged helix-turn-helix domain-containing protein [Saccharopolyspora rosea]
MGLDRTEIADQLRKEIRSGTRPAGSELPPYRVLAKQLGAAPNTVGEAIRLLATEGLVTIRTKRPAKVREVDDDTGPSQEERTSAFRNELNEAQAELRDIRARINALDRRLSGLLTELNT